MIRIQIFRDRCNVWTIRTTIQITSLLSSKLNKFERKSKITVNYRTKQMNYWEDMEGLSVVSDDFLSNGFHQFYTEFQDEILDFDCNVSSSWETVPLISDHNYYKSDTDDQEISLTLNEDVVQGSFDLDYILMDLPNNVISADIELPEITPLCSDSCKFFLKESAENLKFSKTVIQEDETKQEQIPKHVTSNDVLIQKTLKCEFEGCGKSYAKPTHLKAHLKRHQNEKPYICQWPECKWRFSRSDELARHRRSHLGIKPYKCCFCPKSFARSDHLTKHRRVHEKKFHAMNKTSEITWPVVPRGRPGRKPKAKCTEEQPKLYFDISVF